MEPWLTLIVKTRFLVTHLGEIASPPWWNSDATSRASKRMLERIYPRTFLAASLETTSRAASIEHDSRIGKAGAYHLFRLPPSEELAILEVLRHPEGNDLLKELDGLASTEQKLQLLKDLASGEAMRLVQGPVRCGNVEELHDCCLIQRMCATYFMAFHGGTTVYPYLLRYNHDNIV